MDNQTKDKLSNLICASDLEKLELSLRKPNFFSILRVNSVEIRHSNFLAWLLNPNEGHNLSTIFLKWFLRDIFTSREKIKWISEFDVDTLNLKNVQIFREWNNIDILIVHDDFVVCIENKLKSSEHSNQLKRYREIIEKGFHKKNCAFVYLSNEQPENEDDKKTYISYTYEHIRHNVETILEVYSDALAPKVRFFIEDYLQVLRRDIMKDDELIGLAQKIYQNHSEAIDFIIENKPDRLLDVTRIIEKVVQDKGYILGSINKGYTRFLTPELDKIIPRTGINWKKRESFLFELDFWPKKITFKTVISPGDESNRKILSEALSGITHAKDPRSTQWLVHYSKKYKVDATDEKYNDERLKKEILQILEAHEDTIKNVEQTLLEIADKFTK